MGRLHEIRIKSDQFVSQINIAIQQSILSVEDQLLKMNKGNMLNSLDSMNKPLIHKDTGSKNLSLHYSIRTGKQTPNLFLGGNFQKEMFLDVDETKMTYSIDSTDKKNGILTANYGNDIFGIPKDRNLEAKKLTSAAFKRKYESFVFGR